MLTLTHPQPPDPTPRSIARRLRLYASTGEPIPPALARRAADMLEARPAVLGELARDGVVSGKECGS